MKAFLYPAGLTVLSVFLVVIAAFLPIVAIPFLIAATALFSVACALCVSQTQTLIVQGITAAFFLVLLAVSGSAFTAAAALLLFYPVGASVGISFLRKKDLNATGSAVVVFSALLAVAALLLYVFEKTYPDFSVTAALEPVGTAVYDAIVQSLSGGNGATLNSGEITETASLLYSVIVAYSPAVFALWSLFTGVCSFWILRSVMKNSGRDVSHMGGFTEFRVGKPGAVVYLVATILTLFTSSNTIGYVMSNFTLIMSAVFTYAGISLIGFILDFKNISRTKKLIAYILIILACIIPFGFSMIVSIAGIADAWLNIRNRLRNSGA